MHGLHDVQDALRLWDRSWIHRGARGPLAWAPPLLVVLAALRYGMGWPAPLRLAVTTLVLYTALKATAILRQSPGELLRASPAARLAYLTVWPGMSLAPFQARASSHPDGRRWLRRMVGPAISSQRFGQCTGRCTDQILATRTVQLAAEISIRLMPQRRRRPQIV